MPYINFHVRGPGVWSKQVYGIELEYDSLDHGEVHMSSDGFCHPEPHVTASTAVMALIVIRNSS